MQEKGVDRDMAASRGKFSLSITNLYLCSHSEHLDQLMYSACNWPASNVLYASCMPDSVYRSCYKHACFKNIPYSTAFMAAACIMN